MKIHPPAGLLPEFAIPTYIRMPGLQTALRLVSGQIFIQTQTIFGLPLALSLCPRVSPQQRERIQSATEGFFIAHRGRKPTTNPEDSG